MQPDWMVWVQLQRLNGFQVEVQESWWRRIVCRWPVHHMGAAFSLVVSQWLLACVRSKEVSALGAGIWLPRSVRLLCLVVL